MVIWFLAALAYVLLSAFSVFHGWLAFLTAVPVSGIVALSLCSAWHRCRHNREPISPILWSRLTCIHIYLPVFLHRNFRKIYLPGMLGQAAVFLWFWLLRPGKEHHHE